MDQVSHGGLVMKHDQTLPMWISQWQSLTAPHKMRVALIGIAAIAHRGWFSAGSGPMGHPLSKSFWGCSAASICAIASRYSQNVMPLL